MGVRSFAGASSTLVGVNGRVRVVVVVVAAVVVAVAVL